MHGVFPDDNNAFRLEMGQSGAPMLRSKCSIRPHLDFEGLQSYPFNRYCPAQFQAALKWCGQYRLNGHDRMELLPVTSTFPSLRTCATHPSLQHESYSLRACWRAEVGDASKRSDSCGSVRCHMLSMVGPTRTAAPKLWCLEGGMV